MWDVDIVIVLIGGGGIIFGIFVVLKFFNLFINIIGV